MDSEIVDSVTGWETVPVGSGYDGLHDLADAEFSGAVTAGNAWGFMLNGRLVGLRDGSLASFDGGALTAYEAPAPALPLLYTMQSQDNEKQAEYYTNETAIAEADTTLEDGNFTGYIELSENVLSGDYYVVYYGGRSMSVAFVGNSRRLLTDEEAFERANDEVGIYNVYAADIDVIDLPERSSSPSAAADPTPDPGGDDSGATGGADSTESSDGATAGEHRPGSIDIPQAGGADTDRSTDESPTPTTAADTDPTTAADSPADTTTTAADGPTDTRAEEVGHRGDTAVDEPATAGTDTPATGGSTADTNSPGSTADANSPGSTTDTDTGSTAAPTTNGEPFEEEAEWQNTTTIPSLDPSDDEETKGGNQRGGGQQTVTREEGRLSRQQLQARLEKAEAVMEKAEQRHKQLAAERDEAREASAAAEERIEELEAELAAAQERIEELEAELAAADTAADSGHAGGNAATQTMNPADALAGTNLFVRYDSKGAATLADAHDGEATPEEIEANLRIDTHTTFDTEGLEIEDTPFEAFLADRIEVAFAEWLVTDLLFELRSTGATTALKAVYDAIPQIDRIELQGTIELGTDEDDEPIKRTFDVVVRDKRGKPLFIADFDDSKQPVGADLIEGLIRNGNALRERDDSFAAGFGVTSSYFTEEAYEIADDATSGGLFSRSGGASFVNISRKQGFHLCLVDRIKGGFELQKPEL